MKRLLTYFTAIVLTAVGLCCCTATDVSSELDTAEQAIEAQDYDLAKSICSSFNTDSTSTLDAVSLCRLSLIYMKLSDVSDYEINTAAATQCFRSAMLANSDSATAYYNNLPIDDTRYVGIMAQLYKSIEAPSEIYDLDEDVDIDSLLNEITQP